MHGKVVCELGHLVEQCRCIGHGHQTIVAHSDKCSDSAAPSLNPAYEGYKPFYGVELISIAQSALTAAADDEAKAELILVRALRRIEVNTRLQLLEHLVHRGEGVDLSALVAKSHRQALSEYHSVNFWTGNTGKASDIQVDKPD